MHLLCIAKPSCGGYQISIHIGIRYGFGHIWLALAYAEYLGPADRANTLSRRLTVLQCHLFRVLDLPFCTALEAIGIHSLSPSLVYFDSEDTL